MVCEIVNVTEINRRFSSSNANITHLSVTSNYWLLHVRHWYINHCRTWIHSSCLYASRKFNVKCINAANIWRTVTRFSWLLISLNDTKKHAISPLHLACIFSLVKIPDLHTRICIGGIFSQQFLIAQVSCTWKTHQQLEIMDYWIKLKRLNGYSSILLILVEIHKTLQSLEKVLVCIKHYCCSYFWTILHTVIIFIWCCQYA